MRHSLTSAALATLIALPAQAQERQSFTLPARDASVWAVAGELQVVAGSGNSLVLEVTAKGRDASKLRFDTSPVDGRPAFRVIYPDDDIVYPALGRRSNTNFTIRDDWTWGRRHQRSNRKIRVRGDGSGTEAWVEMVVKVPAGSNPSIYVGVGRADATGIEADLSMDAASGDLTARQVKGNLNLDTGSGDVNVTDATGPLSIDTGSGSVTVTGHSGPSLSIDTGSGDVNGSRISTDDLSIDTGSGTVTLQAAGARQLKVDTGSGDVGLGLTLFPDQVDIETGSGGVTVQLPQSGGAELDLETGSGEFEINFPVQLVRKSSDRLVARFGTGSSRITIETGSGDITLRH